MNKIFLIFLVIALLCGIYWYYMKFKNESRTESKKNVSLKKNIFDSEESLKSFDTQFFSKTLDDDDSNDIDSSHHKVNRQKKEVESEYSGDSIDSQISQNSLHSSYFANSESNNSDEESQTNNSDADSQSNESQSNDSQSNDSHSNESHSGKDSDFAEDW